MKKPPTFPLVGDLTQPSLWLPPVDETEWSTSHSSKHRVIFFSYNIKVSWST